MLPAIYDLPSEQRALINSLLRRGELPVKDIARMTYVEMGNVRRPRSLDAWAEMLYNYRHDKHHLKVVRENNLLVDPYIVNDLTITSLEKMLAGEGPISWNLLSSLRSIKTIPASLLDKLEAKVNAKDTAVDEGQAD